MPANKQRLVYLLSKLNLTIQDAISISEIFNNGEGKIVEDFGLFIDDLRSEYDMLNIALQYYDGGGDPIKITSDMETFRRFFLSFLPNKYKDLDRFNYKRLILLNGDLIVVFCYYAAP